jgi:hypothetical protein
MAESDGEPTISIELARLAIAMGENSLARDILGSAQPTDIERPYIILCRAETFEKGDRYDALFALDAAMSVQTNDHKYWLGLMPLALRLRGLEVACKIGHKAEKNLGKKILSVQLDRIRLNISKGQFWRGARALRNLVEAPESLTYRAQEFADLALNCHSPKLAKKFVVRWITGMPDDLYTLSVSGRYLCAALDKQRASIQLQILVKKLHAGAIIDQPLMEIALTTARDIDHRLEDELSDLAAIRFPNVVQFRTMRQPDAFFKTIFAPHPHRKKKIRS